MNKALDIILPALGVGAAATVFKLAGVFYFGGLGWGFQGEMLMFVMLAVGILLAYIPNPKGPWRIAWVLLGAAVFLISLFMFDNIRNNESKIGDQSRDQVIGFISFFVCYLSFAYVIARLIREFTSKKA